MIYTFGGTKLKRIAIALVFLLFALPVLADVSVEYAYDSGAEELLVQGYAPDTAVSTRVQFAGYSNTKSACVPVSDGSDPEFMATMDPTAWNAEVYYLTAQFYDVADCGGAGCPVPVEETQWTDDLENANEWTGFAVSENGISYETSANCASGSCMRVDDSARQGTAFSVETVNDLDTSVCLPGTAYFKLDHVKLTGNLETNDCIYYRFSNDGGSTWSSRVQVFCPVSDSEFNSNAAEETRTLEALIPPAYYDTDMRIMIEAEQWRGAVETAWIDDVSVYCDVETIVACEEVEPRAVGGEFAWLQLQHGDLDLVWDAEDNRLRAKLYFPAGAVHATLYAYDATDDTQAYSVTGLTPEADGNLNYDWDVSGWDLKEYTIKVKYMDADDAQVGRWTTALFTGLALRDIADQLDSIEDAIDLIEGDVTDLQNEVIDIWDAISALDTEVSNVQAQVDALWSMVLSMNHGTINLHHFSPESDWMPDTLRVWGEAPQGAEYAVVNLRDIDKNIVDTITVPVGPLQSNENSYEVFFEEISTYAPIKYQVQVKFYMTGDVWMSGYDVGALFDDLYILWLGAWLNDHETWILEIEGRLNDVNFTVEEHAQWLAEIDANLTEVWDELDLINAELLLLWQNATDQQEQIEELMDRVADLEERMDDVEELLEEMNHGTINLFHITNDNMNELWVWGEAPEGATGATVYIIGVDEPLQNGYVYTDSVSVVENFNWLPGLENTYAFHGLNGKGIDLTGEEFGPEKYNVVVVFEGVDPFYTVSALFDDLLLIWIEEQILGFNILDTQTFEVWNPLSSFVRKISWTFTAEESGEYWFELVQVRSDNEEDISKEFADGECYSLTGHETRTFSNRNVRFPPMEGHYVTKLVAHNCETNDKVRSNRFGLIIDDLANPWPLFGVTTVPVDPDYNNYADGIYWTNNMDVNLMGILGSETEWDGNRCEIRTYLNEQLYSSIYQAFDIESEYSCDVWLDLDLFDPTRPGEADEFDIEICGQPSFGNPECDPVIIGFDEMHPVIDVMSITPNENDNVSGLVNFSANVSDNGVVKSVEFILTLKGEEEPTCNLGFATEIAQEVWQITNFDTESGCTPDGAYDLTVVAEDFAGNVASVTIDPIIDNTEPIIDSFTLPSEFLLGWENLISADVSDELSGVGSVEAHLTAYQCLDNICLPCGEEATLTARKEYGPSTWFDGEYFFCTESTWELPDALTVTEGNSGNHRARLMYHEGEDTVTCVYQGGSSQSKPTGEQVALGLEYNKFIGCWYNIDTAFPSGTPDVELEPGDEFTTNYIWLHIDNGATKVDNVPQDATEIEATLNPAGECPGECVECSDTIPVPSSKSYNPSTWEFSEMEFCEPVRFDVPETIPVAEGNAGNHWAKFYFETESTDITCVYQGGSSQSHPSGQTQLDLGMNWEFYGCYEDYNNAIPPNQVPLLLEAGNTVEVTKLSLEVNGDNGQGTTVSGLILENQNECSEVEEDELVCDFVNECENSRPLDVPVEIVPMELTSGTHMSGTWEGPAGDFLVDSFFDVFYDIEFVADDRAGNTGSSFAKNGVNQYQGYDLEIVSATPNPVSGGAAVTVAGTLELSNDPLADVSSETVTIGTVTAPVVTGIGWVMSVSSPNNDGTVVYTAEHTNACGVTVTDSVTVNTIAVSLARSGGGGGGGNFFEPLSTQSEPQEGTSQNDFLPDEGDEQSGGSGQEQATGGNGEDLEQNEPQSEPEPEPEPNQITGAVTGGGFGTGAWLGLALLILATLFTAVWLLKRK